MGIDRHAGVGESIRAALATALYPVQFALRQPMVWAAGMADFLQRHGDAITENQRLERALLESSLQAQRTQYLTIENQRLEALLELRAIQSNHSIAARVVAETPDTYAARVVIDKGSVDGVLAGAAVIDTQGVFGQVTTVYPFSSEVTLITDPNHATPVMNARTGTRAVLFGAQKSGPPFLRCGMSMPTPMSKPMTCCSQVASMVSTRRGSKWQPSTSCPIRLMRTTAPSIARQARALPSPARCW